MCAPPERGTLPLALASRADGGHKALAESLHHSAQRPKMARAGRGTRSTTRPRSGSASLLGAGQHLCLRSLASGTDLAPLVQILDAPVPQMVDQLPDIVQFFRALSPDPEQVIEGPKILPHDVPMRTAVRDSQLAEQLVEVPTIISFSSLQRTMEQHVDIPDPGGGGRHADLQGFLPETRFLRNALLSGLWSRSLISPFLLEVFKIFAQIRVHPHLRTFQQVFMKLWMSLVKGFFRTSPRVKKSAKVGALGRNWPRTKAHPRWAHMAW